MRAKRASIALPPAASIVYTAAAQDPAAVTFLAMSDTRHRRADTIRRERGVVTCPNTDSMESLPTRRQACDRR